jgi:hypothetical protein
MQYSVDIRPQEFIFSPLPFKNNALKWIQLQSIFALYGCQF